MLPAAHRMHRTADFTVAVRSGARSRGGSIVVHHARADTADNTADETADVRGDAALVGFVVSRQVGGSVVRHRVARRLRAQVARRLTLLPAGTRTVVRALPTAASATSTELGADLDRALDRLVRR